MEGEKKSENIIGRKVQGDSKIPKSAKYPTTKETSSKTTIEKKTAQSSKTATKITSTTSSKLKQTQSTNLPRNVKRMSVAKISKDIMNHFQIENLKSGDHVTESAAVMKVLGKENVPKRAPLKEQCSQESQKQCGSLSKRSSAPDLKQCTAFGGIRFTKKNTTSRKFDMFQNMAKESKNSQAVNPSEPLTEKLKRSVSAKVIGIKEIEWSNEENLEDPPILTTEASKVGSLTMKQGTLKKCPAFGGIRFKPMWHSTPLKPDLFENMPKVSKHNKEICPPDSTVKQPETISKPAEAITNEVVETITRDETVQPPTKEANCLKPLSFTMKELGDKMYPAFGGMRLTPKRKSTHPKPGIFEKVEEEPKTDDSKLPFSDSSTKELKTIPVFTTSKIKVQTDEEKLELPKSENPESLKNDETSKNMKKVVPPAFGGLRFKPRQKKLHDVFEAQKSKVDNQV